VVQEDTPGLEQAKGRAEIVGKVALPDMLHHADADDFIEDAELLCFSIIHETHLASRG
jgi:hypothetical protein